MIVVEAETQHPLDQMPLDFAFMQRLTYRERLYGIKQANQLKTPEDRQLQHQKLREMIGKTPLIRIPVDEKGTIFAKMESENPTESHYDRATLAILQRLEREGLIKPGDTILEGTSGSAGRSFAYFCNRLGFKLDMIVPLPQEMPQERIKDMVVLGANIIRADRLGGIGKVIEKFRRRLVELRREGYIESQCILDGKPMRIFTKGNNAICAPNHSEIIITPQSFGRIAEETLGQLPQGAQIDTFIGTLGNGSTIKGISEGLKKKFTNLRVVGTEDYRSPTNAVRKLEREFPGDSKVVKREFEKRYGYPMPSPNEFTYHDSFGASTPGSYKPEFIELDRIDEIIVVGDEWREEKARHNLNAYLEYDDASTIGNTSAENLWVAQAMIRQGKAKNVLILFYDKADQYRDWPPLAYRPFSDMLDFVRVVQKRNVRHSPAVTGRGAL